MTMTERTEAVDAAIADSMQQDRIVYLDTIANTPEAFLWTASLAERAERWTDAGTEDGITVLEFWGAAPEIPDHPSDWYEWRVHLRVRGN